MNGQLRHAPSIAWRFQLQSANWQFSESILTKIDEPTTVVLDFPGIQISAAGTERDRYLINFPGQAQIRVDFEKRTLDIQTAAGASGDVLDHLISNQVIPRILAHEGVLVIHAAAIRIGEAALVLVGRSGTGKSTLSASFYAAGYKLLGDDAIKVVDGQGPLAVEAVSQSLRLFPDSYEALLPDHVNWVPVTGHSDKRRALDLEPVDEAPMAPVKAVLFLDPAPAEATSFTRLNAAESCFGLVENSFWLDVGDSDQLRSQIASAGALVAGIDSFRVSYPRDYSKLGDLRSQIIDRWGSATA